MTTPVVVGILITPDHQVLLAQRPSGKPYAGYWEFPGGKVETDESLMAALQREFQEELGMHILSATPWCCLEYHYPHAQVRLHIYLITSWQSEPQSLENQAFGWYRLAQKTSPFSPLLPATVLVLQWLAPYVTP